MLNKRNVEVLCLALSLAMFAAGCKKKVPPPAPPPPPPPATVTPTPAAAAPTVAQFSAEPTSIQRGESSTLRWQVTGDVSSVSIDNAIGTVQNTGNRRVSPSESTTYTLTATGAGGSTTASVTVNVSAPAPPPPPTPTATTNKGSLPSRLQSDVQDVYFDYDKNDVRGDAQQTLTQDATAIKGILADFPDSVIVVEGHCDERGSAEYNLGLGDRRASSAKDFLVQLGVPADKLRTISYGKEHPQCTEADEACYQKNRRVHFSAGQ
jgi:peptidoglycan-associated lipoprotein